MRKFNPWGLRRDGSVYLIFAFSLEDSPSLSTIRELSPPQRLLLVNTSERNGSGSAGERKRERGERFPARFNFSSSQPPRAAGIFFPGRDCGRPLRRREIWEPITGEYTNWPTFPARVTMSLKETRKLQVFPSFLRSWVYPRLAGFYRSTCTDIWF